MRSSRTGIRSVPGIWRTIWPSWPGMVPGHRGWCAALHGGRRVGRGHLDPRRRERDGCRTLHKDDPFWKASLRKSVRVGHWAKPYWSPVFADCMGTLGIA